MLYRTLRGTGATVSRFSLGTMTFGRQIDEAESIRMVHLALDSGINFVDEADIYAGGKSEIILGKALKGKRDSVVLASKVCNRSGPDRLRDSGLHRHHVIKGVEDILQRLQTDRLDILYMHRPDYRTPIEETLAAFDHLVSQGKILYVGMCNYAAWQVCDALGLCDRNRWARPIVIQVPYSLLTRSVEAECVAFCDKKNIGMTVYNPLAAGLLTGKHSGSAPPAAGSRFATDQQYYDRYWHEANFRAIKALTKIAKESGKSLIELSLQWLLAQPHVDSVILGASKQQHLEENIKATHGTLDEDALEACDEVWAQLRGPLFQYNR